MLLHHKCLIIMSHILLINIDDLRIFRKYLNLLSLKEFQLKRQQKIDFYFTK